MRRHIQKRKCKHCKAFFDPDHRNVGRQRYCSQPPCRQASQAASQLRWRHKPANRDYFRGPDNVKRVQQWRRETPGSWRRKAPQVSQEQEALQETFRPQGLETQSVNEGGNARGVTRFLLHTTGCFSGAYRTINRICVAR